MEKYWVSKVKQLAALHDLKIGQIPGLVGINFHTFSKNIQMGRMSSDNLQKIADYFGIQLDELVNPNFVGESQQKYRRLNESERLELVEERVKELSVAVDNVKEALKDYKNK